MVNIGPLAAEICWRVLGTLANFNRFRVLAALLHSTLVVGVSQTLRRWTEGATYIHVGHWPTFVVLSIFFFLSSPNLSGRILDVYHTLRMVWPWYEFRITGLKNSSSLSHLLMSYCYCRVGKRNLCLLHVLPHFIRFVLCYRTVVCPDFI